MHVTSAHFCNPVLLAGGKHWLTMRHVPGRRFGVRISIQVQSDERRAHVLVFCCRNAGTDCRVFLQLTGEACTGPPVELQDPSGAQQGAAFQRGCLDSFNLQLPMLGQLKMAAVWLEGRASPWHLDLVVVTGPTGKGDWHTDVAMRLCTLHIVLGQKVVSQ